MITVQFVGLDRAIADLRKFRERALPYAMKTAVNTAAFEARRIWQAEIKTTFTNRNQFTVRSVLVDRAKGGGTAKEVHAIVGSVAPYMGDQETGATVRGRGAHKAIPGPAAAGLAPGAKRTRLVRAANRLSAITVQHPTLKGTRQQRNAIALAMARRHGQKVALLERPRGGKGLFRLMGGKRKVTTRLLWDVSRDSVRVPAAPTLQRTLTSISPKLPHMYLAAVVEQLQRHHVLGY